MKPLQIIVLALRFLVAGIFLQTLYFKFSGAEESVFIFQSLGMDPLGRYATAVAEFAAAALLLHRLHYRKGALLSFAIIAPAILLHITVLGIVVQNDGGLLFGLACTILAASIAILLLSGRWEKRV